jgi:hypothetical protein
LSSGEQSVMITSFRKPHGVRAPHSGRRGMRRDVRRPLDSRTISPTGKTRLGCSESNLVELWI